MIGIFKKEKSNKKIGNDFERELCNILSKQGYWVHNFTQNHSGQPADIIAVGNKDSFLIDAKVCTNDVFDLSRIEDNQQYSMLKWEDTGNTAYFAFKTSKGIYFIDFYIMLHLQNNKKRLKLKDIENFGITLEEWAINGK